jgi:hypothetical protein
MRKSGSRKIATMSFFAVYIFIVSYALAGDKGSAFAADNNSVFSVGEKLRYNIYASGIYVGYQIIELEKVTTIDGVETYVLKGLSKTAAYISIFYRLNDRWVIYMDKNTYLPVRIEKDYVEGKQKGYYIYDIRQDDNLVILHNKNTGKEKLIQSQNTVFDLFSLIYFFRNNSAVIEEEYTFDFLEPKSVRTVHFRDEGKKEVNVPKISSDQKIQVREITQIGGVGIRIFVGSDDLKLPLKMIVPAKLKGKRKMNVEFILDRYSPGENHKNVPVIYDRL